jgi:hypothetical protein
MAKFVARAVMSLDGHDSASDGNPLVLPIDAAFEACKLGRIRAAGSLLLGAAPYWMFMGFRPPRPTNSSAPAVHRESGEIYGRIAVDVVSDPLTATDVAPWAEQMAIVRRVDGEARSLSYR